MNEIVLFALMSLFVLLKEGKLATYFKWLLPLFAGCALICIFLTGAKGVWISLAMILILGNVTSGKREDCILE